MLTQMNCLFKVTNNATALGWQGVVFRLPMTAAKFITNSSLIHSNARLYSSAWTKAEACK